MRFFIKYPAVILLIMIVFSTCEYEEEAEEKSSGKGSFRITTINVEGEVDDITSQTYTYDEYGYISMIVKRDSEGNTVTIQYMYDNNGNITQETRVEDGDVQITRNEYDGNFKIHSETVTDGGVILQKVDYYYDSKGFLVKKEIRDPSNAVRGTVTFSYEQEPVRGAGKEISEYMLVSQ